MPEKDLWVGTAEPDPTSIVDSTGSCDSVISNTSSSLEMTDSGYDYLSVEEKECLMFLEETLHSLDTEEGSGLSTGEAETAEPSKHPRTWPTRDVPKELDHDYLGKNKTFDSIGNKTLFGSVPAVVLSPGHYSLPQNINIKNSVQASKGFVAETTGTNADDRKTLPPTHSMSRGPSKHDTLDVRNELPEINTQERISDLELVVIPPPEPFQDKSQSYLGIRLEPILTDTRKVIESGPTSHFQVTRNRDIREECEARAVQQEVLLGKMEVAPGSESLLKPLSPKHNKNSFEQRIGSQETDDKSILEVAQLDSSFRHGPPTAPKPRKLPPNIILKTSKSNVVSPSVDPKIKVLLASNGRPRAATGDFSVEKAHGLQKEQGRARREALEKLGLPLDNEKNSDEHVIKTSVNSKPRETSRTGSREKLNMDDVTSNKQSVQQSDQTGGENDQPIELSKQAHFKSYTLERSGVGLSSCISLGSEGQNLKNNKTSFLNKITPGFLRNNRLRPASFGTGKDFLDVKEDKLHNVELEKNYERRSYPLQPPSKLPRPPCVSVKITPKGTTEEHRREALRKLGLLKE